MQLLWMCLPVVELVDGEGAPDEAGSENRCVQSNDFPHGRVVVGEDLELGIQVEVQEDEAGESSSGMARRHRLEAVVDLLAVTSADAAVEHDLAVAIGNVAGAALVTVVVDTECACGNDGLADGEEVGAQTADEPLDEDLEHGSRDECVQESDGGVVDVPEATCTDLNNQEDGEGDEEGHEGSSPDGNNFWVGVST
jgi:hypothetical protein